MYKYSWFTLLYGGNWQCCKAALMLYPLRLIKNVLINIGIWNKKIRLIVLILHLIITWLLINYKIVLFSIHKELLLKLNEISYMKNADKESYRSVALFEFSILKEEFRVNSFKYFTPVWVMTLHSQDAIFTSSNVTCKIQS